MSGRLHRDEQIVLFYNPDLVLNFTKLCPMQAVVQNIT